MRLPDQHPSSSALDQWIRSSLFESTAEICFLNQPSEISILKPHFPLRKTYGAEDLMTHGILDLDSRDPLQVFGTSGFSPSIFLSTSHFKTLEAHFHKGLDQLPHVPFKINNSYSLQGLFFWCYTSCKFALPNVCEPLIWIAPKIFVAERLKLSFAYTSISKQTI
jgi:hypothetical protein